MLSGLQSEKSTCRRIPVDRTETRYIELLVAAGMEGPKAAQSSHFGVTLLPVCGDSTQPGDEGRRQPGALYSRLQQRSDPLQLGVQLRDFSIWIRILLGVHMLSRCRYIRQD